MSNSEIGEVPVPIIEVASSSSMSTTQTSSVDESPSSSNNEISGARSRRSVSTLSVESLSGSREGGQWSNSKRTLELNDGVSIVPGVQVLAGVSLTSLTIHVATSLNPRVSRSAEG